MSTITDPKGLTDEQLAIELEALARETVLRKAGKAEETVISMRRPTDAPPVLFALAVGEEDTMYLARVLGCGYTV